MVRAFRMVTLVTALATVVGGAAPALASRYSALARGTTASVGRTTSAGPESAAGSGGARLWLSRYQGAAESDSRPAGMAVSPDGSRVFVTGTVENPSPDHSPYFATVAYAAATGAKLWSARYVGPSGAFLGASAIAVSPDGSTVFVTGATPAKGIANVEEYATVAYDAATGAEMWLRTYAGPVAGDAEASALAVSPDSSAVFVTGRAAGTTGEVIGTVAYNANTGATLWSEHLLGGGGSAVRVSPDGSRVLVSGSGEGATAGDIVETTVAYSASTGTEQWTARDHEHGDPAPCYLAVSPDGSQVFVATTAAPLPTGYAVYLTLAYDAATGTLQWKQTYSVSRQDNSPDSIAVNPDGSAVYVTGQFNETGTGRMGTIAYAAATGAVLWTEHYPSGGSGLGASVAVSPDGSQVFVAGGAGQPESFATVDYDASTGAVVWAERYSGGAATAVVASPAGDSVFVTGSTGEYTTLAYSVSG